MQEDWLMYWGWKFLKIAVYQTVFSWQFVITVTIVAVVYLALTFFQGTPPDGKAKRRFFRFGIKDMLFYLGVTLAGLVIILALGVSITLHANSYAEATTKGCLIAEDTGNAYEFKLPENCVQQPVLWNRVVLDKTEAQPAFDYLTKNNK